MKNKIAIFPGTFDPFTLGHHNIVLRGLKIFDTIHIAIGNNALQSMTGGTQQDNCCVGKGSGLNANDASGAGNRQNAFFGNSSGYRNTTGEINTCIGFSAGGFTGGGGGVGFGPSSTGFTSAAQNQAIFGQTPMQSFGPLPQG